jgi:hypothetical protein
LIFGVALTASFQYLGKSKESAELASALSFDLFSDELKELQDRVLRIAASAEVKITIRRYRPIFLKCHLN